MTHGLAKAIGYLSGSPRVSTAANVETTGARAHVLGTIGGFEASGWAVERFIVGDELPASVSAPGSHRSVARAAYRRFLADAVRLSLGQLNAYRAYSRLRGRVAFVYERLGVFQRLGLPFVKNGVPWILESNGLLFKEAHETRRTIALHRTAGKLEIDAYRRCSAVVCVSTTLRDTIAETAGIGKNKVVVCPNAVDTDRFDPSRYQPKRVCDGFVVGMVGNLYPWSGADLLLKASAALRAEGTDIKVVLVGDGIAMDDLKSQAKQLGISQNVHFVGRVAWQEVPEYLMGFDLAFSGQTSRVLGGAYRSPLKLYEYMAMARAVVSADSEDARSVIANDKNGFLYIPDDEASLAAALRDAVASAPRLSRFGERARHLVVRKHSWNARIEQLLEQLEPILQIDLTGSGALGG